MSSMLLMEAFSPLGVCQRRLRLFLCGYFNRLKLPVDKSSCGALAVGFNSHQQARRRGGFVMRIRHGLQMFNHPLPTRWRIHRLQAGGDRFDVASPAQGQHMISAQQRFERTPNFGPKLNLPGDGSFHRLARKPGIQQQRIRNFDWLTHVKKVAKCYQLSSACFYDRCDLLLWFCHNSQE